MGPDLQAAVEPDQEVLALRFDRIDALADDPLDLRDRPGTLGAGRQHVPTDEVRPQPGGGAEERVAFGHRGLGRAYRAPRRTRPR